MYITKRIVSKSKKNVRPGYYMNPEYITIHETENRDEGADAEAHATYLENGAGGAEKSWHFTVDSKSIYQHLPTNENGWHAGDGGSGTGNRKSIGIEICENADGDFDKAVKNAVWLIQKLMDEHNIPVSRIVPHKKWSGKNCPNNLLRQWDGFIDYIKGSDEFKVDHKPEKETKATGRWANIQATLNRRYNLNISVDNVPGKETKWAITVGYQTELNKQFNRGLVVDGIFGPKTREATVNVYVGSRGRLTWILQAALLWHGFDPGPIDGIHGKRTQRALKAFQRAKKIAIDGIAGKQTWSKLLG